MANGNTVDFTAFERTKRTGKPPQNITIKVIEFNTDGADATKHFVRGLNSMTGEEMKISLRVDPDAAERTKPRPEMLDFAGVSGPHKSKVSVKKDGTMRFDNVWPVDRMPGLHTASWGNTISREPGHAIGVTAFARINRPVLPDTEKSIKARASIDVLAVDKDDRTRVSSTVVKSKDALMEALSAAIDSPGKKTGNSAALVRFVATVDGVTKTGDLFVPPMSEEVKGQTETYRPLPAAERWQKLLMLDGTGARARMLETIVADPESHNAVVEVIPATRLPIIGDSLIALVDKDRLSKVDRAYRVEVEGVKFNGFALSEVGFRGSDPEGLQKSQMLYYTHCERRGSEFPLFQPNNVPSANFEGVPEIRESRDKVEQSNDAVSPGLG